MMLPEVKWQWEITQDLYFSVLHFLNYFVTGQKKAYFLFGICMAAGSGIDQIP